MKLDKTERQKSGIRQLGFEVQALQEEANRLDLPDDIPALLESWAKDAETLSDELEQKDRLKNHLKAALNFYHGGDIQRMRLSILRVMNLFVDANHDKWVLGIKKQFGRNADGLRRHHKDVTKPKHDLWQELADNFRKKATREMSKLELARKVKEYLDEHDSKNSGAVTTIRKSIK